VVPLQVGAPLVVLHTLPQAPHDVVELLLTQVPLQLMSPLPHWQLPFVQLVPPVHPLPHDPQLLSSVCSFTQSPLHNVYVVVRELLQLMPQAPPLLHVAEPLEGGAGHAVHEVPQLLGDVLLSQVPPQLCVPLAQHLPSEHEDPLPQTAPQPPQLWLSVNRSGHEEPHSV
jgi:hypothetical protein